MDNALLQKLAEQFGLALDWGSENVVPYLQQLAERVVKYEVSQSIFWLVVGVLLILMGIASFILVCKGGFSNDTVGYLIILGFCGIIIGVVIIGCQITDLIECKYLPEKILLRYVNSK